MEKCFVKPDAGHPELYVSWEDKLTDQLEQANERIEALGIVEGLIDKAERPADAAAAFLNLVGGLLLDGDQAVRSNVLRAIYKNRAHLSMEQVAPHMRGLLLGLEETIVAVPQSSGGGKGKAPSKPPKDKRLETRNAASSLLGWLRTDMQADFAALAPQGFSMATAKLLGNVLTTAESTDQPAASNSEARAEDLRVKSEVQGGSANAVSEINALKEELELWRSGQKTLVQEENVDTGETSTQEMSRSKRQRGSMDDPPAAGGFARIVQLSERNGKVKQELSGQKQELDDQRSCILCMGEERSVVFLDCKHFACCADCAKDITECPAPGCGASTSAQLGGISMVQHAQSFGM